MVQAKVRNCTAHGFEVLFRLTLERGAPFDLFSQLASLGINRR